MHILHIKNQSICRCEMIKYNISSIALLVCLCSCGTINKNSNYNYIMPSKEVSEKYKYRITWSYTSTDSLGKIEPIYAWNDVFMGKGEDGLALVLEELKYIPKHEKFCIISRRVKYPQSLLIVDAVPYRKFVEKLYAIAKKRDILMVEIYGEGSGKTFEIIGSHINSEGNDPESARKIFETYPAGFVGWKNQDLGNSTAANGECEDVSGEQASAKDTQ